MEKHKSHNGWHVVSLRLEGDNLPDADAIATRLQLPTSHSGRKGQHYRDIPRYPQYLTHCWIWDFTADVKVAFEEQIAGFLAMLEQRTEALDELKAIPGTEILLVLQYSDVSGQGSAYLSSMLLTRVTALGLSIKLHFLPPGNRKAD